MNICTFAVCMKRDIWDQVYLNLFYYLNFKQFFHNLIILIKVFTNSSLLIFYFRVKKNSYF